MDNIEQITANTESAVCFCRWFQESYQKLKSSLQVHTASDEDVFHDTFLLIRQRILYRGEIADYAPYFASAYRKNLTKQKLREGRFVYPDELFFRTLAIADECGKNENLDHTIYILASDMDKFVKSHFSPKEYELYSLYIMDNGFSANELSRYTGLSSGTIYRMLSGIKKAVLRNPSFRLRWKQYLLQAS